MTSESDRDSAQQLPKKPIMIITSILLGCIIVVSLVAIISGSLWKSKDAKESPSASKPPAVTNKVQAATAPNTNYPLIPELAKPVIVPVRPVEKPAEKPKPAVTSAVTKIKGTIDTLIAKSRLNETIADCDRRYGTPLNVKENNRSYEHDGIKVDISFENGKAAKLTYYSRPSIFGLDKATKLVIANGEKAAWTPPVRIASPNDVTGSHYEWYRSDGGRAAYTIHGDKDKKCMLAVMSHTWFTQKAIEMHKALYQYYSAKGNIEGL